MVVKGDRIIYHKTKDDFMKHLKTQIRYLENSSKSYDDGFEDEAPRLATAIRVLFHDYKRNSTSLLTHLQVKNNIHLISSVDQYIPNNLVSYLGFLTLRYTVGGEALYIPNCTNDDECPNKWLSFNDWWNEIVLDDKVNIFSRRELVLKVANKDGGTHVDESLNEDYAGLTVNNSIGWFYEIENDRHPFDNNPAYACIRQIAQEVLLSLKLYNMTRSFTRRTQNKNIKAAYIDDNLYIYKDDKTDPLRSKLFFDSRVKRIENRNLYKDEVLLSDNGAFTRATII